MDAPPPAIDQTTVTPSTCFLDPVWLQQVGGARADNVLAYFERSPFFERGEGLEFGVVSPVHDPRNIPIARRRVRADALRDGGANVLPHHARYLVPTVRLDTLWRQA